jgi:small subunit ribosomal protein S4e
MGKHLKRLAAPRVIPIPRKTHKWLTKARAGPHPLERAIPLLTCVRDILKYADTAKEAKHIIKKREINIDGRPVKDHKFPIGLMDVLSIKKIDEHYRMMIDKKGKLRFMKIKSTDASWKLVRIENKTTIKGKRIQLNLHDGRNIILPKNMYKTGDVLKITVPDQKIIAHYPLAEDAVAMLIGGKHVGEYGSIKKYEIKRSSEPNIVFFKEGFSTTKPNVFVVGYKNAEVKFE